MIIKNYNFSEKEISCVVSDAGTSNYLWIAFKKNSSGICKLKKVSANNPLQTYYTISLTTNEIKKGIISGNFIYFILDDSTLIARRYTKSNPLSFVTNFSIPSGIEEVPVDILVDTYVNLLIPGNESGKNAKIVRMTTAGVFYETIDLPTVINASSFTKVGNEFWVVTDTEPGTYIRVYFDVTWQYTVNS